MTQQLAALYELQSLDVKISQINAGLAALAGAKALKQQLAAAQSIAQEAAGKLTEHETELADSELKLKSIDEKRSSVEKRLYGGTVSSPRELQALEKEVGILKRQQGDLDGRTLELYDLVEAAREQARSVESTVAQIEKKVADTLASESSRRAQLEAELAECTSEREAAAAGVTDRSLMSRYDAVRKKSAGTGIAKIVEGKCERCHVAVTSFVVRKAHEAKEFQSCENCGRILMLDIE